MAFDLPPDFPPAIVRPVPANLLRAPYVFRNPGDVLLGLIPSSPMAARAKIRDDGAEPTLEYVGSYTDTGSSTTYNHMVDIGTWSDDLFIIVTAHFSDGRLLASGTGQGQEGFVHETAGNGRGVGIMSFKPTAGGSVTISVTASAGSAYNVIGVWRRRHGVSMWPHATGSQVSGSEGSRSVEVEVPGDNGFLIAAASSQNTTAVTTTNATERYDFGPEANQGVVGADWENAGSTANRDVTMNSARAMVSVSWPGKTEMPPLAGLSPTGAWSAGRVLVPGYSGGLVTDVGGGEISALLDQSGNSYNFTQSTSANRPTLTTGGPKNRPCLQFDGVNDRLDGPQVGNLIANNNGYVVISAIVHAVTSNNGAIYSNNSLWTDANNFVGVFLKSEGPILQGYNWDSNVDTPTAHSIATAVPIVAEWRHVSGSLATRVNGGAWNSVSSGNTSSLISAIVLGGLSSYATSYSVFDLASFNSTPSDIIQRRIAGKMYEWVAG